MTHAASTSPNLATVLRDTAARRRPTRPRNNPPLLSGTMQRFRESMRAIRERAVQDLSHYYNSIQLEADRQMQRQIDELQFEQQERLQEAYELVQDLRQENQNLQIQSDQLDQRLTEVEQTAKNLQTEVNTTRAHIEKQKRSARNATQVAALAIGACTIGTLAFSGALSGTGASGAILPRSGGVMVKIFASTI